MERGRGALIEKTVSTFACNVSVRQLATQYTVHIIEKDSVVPNRIIFLKIDSNM